jgi:hypothetical protein
MYGMIEAGYLFNGRPGDSEDKMTTTVGCVLDHIEVRIFLYLYSKSLTPKGNTFVN